MEDYSRQFDQGIELFNRGDFYECHDTFEEIWLQESSDRQPFLQGLIQAAVAFHHYRHGKSGAARTMLRLSLEKLSGYPDAAEGIDLSRLRGELETWKRALDQSLSSPRPAEIGLEYPRIWPAEPSP